MLTIDWKILWSVGKGSDSISPICNTMWKLLVAIINIDHDYIQEIIYYFITPNIEASYLKSIEDESCYKYFLYYYMINLENYLYS